MTLQERGENWLRFRVDDPQTANPILLRRLIEQNLEVVTFQEIEHSLEMVFLGAVRQGEEAQA